MQDHQFWEYKAMEERLKSPEQKRKEAERNILCSDIEEITADCPLISNLENKKITYDLLCEWVLKTEIRTLSRAYFSDKKIQYEWLSSLVDRYKSKYKRGR